MRRSPKTRRAVAARLQQLQQPAGPLPEAGAPPRRMVRNAFGLALLVIVLGTGGVVWHRLVAPPPAVAARRLTDGTLVRLLAVTREGLPRYDYTPPTDPFRRFVERMGWQPGWPAIDVTAAGRPALPDDAITLWLQVTRPAELDRQRLEFRADDGAVYRPGESGSVAERLGVVQSDQRPWGRGTLVWVSLTNFDQTAQRLTAAVPFAPLGEAAEFLIDGPAAAPAEWAVTGSFPFTAGDRDALLQLHQLRPAQPEVMGLALDGAPPPEPVDGVLLADIDVTEPAGPTEAGTWRLTWDALETQHGERLMVVPDDEGLPRDHAGLAWLSSGRALTGVEAVRLKVSAEKQVRGQGLVIFRNLTLPEVGKKEVWGQTFAGPFHGAEFDAQACERPRADTIVVTIQARAPAGTTFSSFVYQEGLEQEGRRLRNLPGTPLPPSVPVTGAAGSTWDWTFEGKVFSDTRQIALAFRVGYLYPAKRTSATFIAPVQPLLTPADRATGGLVLEPLVRPGMSRPGVRVAEIVPGSSASASTLRPGDELLTVENLPPTAWRRIMLRHRPGDTVDVLFQRGEQRFRTQVRLDPAPATPSGPVPAAPPPASETGAAAPPPAAVRREGEPAAPTTPPIATPEGDGAR